MSIRSLDPEVLCSENLVNCWVREGGNVGLRNGVLRIPLRACGKELEIPFYDRTLLGDVRLHRLTQLEGRELGAMELADTLVRELRENGAEHGGLTPDWRENLESSLSVLRRICAERMGSGGELNPDFLRSEQSFYLGHRFHPSPKSRIGFAVEDLKRYSPEWAPRFKLRYFGVREDAMVLFGDQRASEAWREKSREISGETDRWIFPVHPWQANRALQVSEIRQGLDDGALVDLGERGPEFSVTSSVRTLYQPEWDLFVKTSLDVRITNCFRRNLPEEMETVQYVRGAIRRLWEDRESFRLLDEPLSMDLHPRFPIRLGVIFREGIAAERERGIEPLVAGALFGDREFGVRRLALALGFGQSGPDVVSWFTKYCELLIPPMVEAFFRQGLMFEPHLQNILVGLRDGKAVRVLLRDLDNVKAVEGSPAAFLLKRAPGHVLKEALYDEETAWKRLVYCLIVNHLSEAIASLARLDGSAGENAQEIEHELWGALRRVLACCHGSEDRVRQLLRGAPLWAKKNFFTRVTRTADKIAPFAGIPNPMQMDEKVLETA